jgi:hypothetical protein
MTGLAGTLPAPWHSPICARFVISSGYVTVLGICAVQGVGGIVRWDLLLFGHSEDAVAW